MEPFGQGSGMRGYSRFAEEGISLAAKVGETLKEVPLISALPALLQEPDRLQSLFWGRGQSRFRLLCGSRIQEINFGVLEGSRFKDENGTILSEEMKIFFRQIRKILSVRKTGKIFQIF